MKYTIKKSVQGVYSKVTTSTNSELFNKEPLQCVAIDYYIEKYQLPKDFCEEFRTKHTSRLHEELVKRRFGIDNLNVYDYLGEEGLQLADKLLLQIKEFLVTHNYGYRQKPYVYLLETVLLTNYRADKYVLPYLKVEDDIAKLNNALLSCSDFETYVKLGLDYESFWSIFEHMKMDTTNHLLLSYEEDKRYFNDVLIYNQICLAC